VIRQIITAPRSAMTRSCCSRLRLVYWKSIDQQYLVRHNLNPKRFDRFSIPSSVGLWTAFPILAKLGTNALDGRRKRDRRLARAKARELGAPPDAG
jgi:hypothetical protein